MTNNDMPSAETPATKPVAILKGDRSRAIALSYPVEYDGIEYTTITVRRMTGAEVSAFYTADGDEKRLPMFDCPIEVIEALDADDAENVSKAVIDFLPRSMRAAAD